MSKLALGNSLIPISVAIASSYFSFSKYLDHGLNDMGSQKFINDMIKHKTDLIDERKSISLILLVIASLTSSILGIVIKWSF